MTEFSDNPRKAEYYNPDTYRSQESEREYYEVNQVRGVYESGYEWERRPEMVNLTLYLDPLTGVVVWDIVAYENSLKENSEDH